MPEKGWKSITVREETALKLREMADTRKTTIDKLINEWMNPTKKKKWIKCTVCGIRIKSENIDSHMKRVHPKK